MPRATDSGSATGRDVGMLLRAWSDGDPKVLDQLTPIVCDDLQRLARRYLRGERRDHSLQTIARFFGGLSVEESAEVLGVSPVTVMRDWRTAKAWLYRELSSGSSDD